MKSLLTSAVALALVLAVTTLATAEQPRYNPGNGTSTSTPLLGFQGHMVGGSWQRQGGMMVDYTNWNSVARRAGLESGDIITRINGQPITSTYAYQEALRQANDFNGGFVRLVVDNSRNPGQLVLVQFNLNN